MVGRMIRRMLSLRKGRRRIRKISKKGGRRRIRKISKKGGRRRSIKKRLGRRRSIRTLVGGSGPLEHNLIKNTIDFDTYTKFSSGEDAWFLSAKNLLVNPSKDIKNLSNGETDTAKFVKSACILRHKNQDFAELLLSVINGNKYESVMPTAALRGISPVEEIPSCTVVDNLLKRLIYNRPIVFFDPNDVGSTYWEKLVANTNMTPVNVGGTTGVPYNPLKPYSEVNDEYHLKYQLASLGSLIGCCCLTPITNSGKRKRADTQHAHDEKFFDGNILDKNYNTQSYVCGLVGARFEKPDQMESAYIIDNSLPAETSSIYNLLYNYFKKRMDDHSSTYASTGELTQKEKLYRERIRFTFEIFIDKCIELDTADVKICPVFTGLGAGVWAPKWINADNLHDILEDAILSALLSRGHPFEVIRFASMKQYPSTMTEDHKIAVSEDFKTKYKRTKYKTLVENTTFVHNHFMGPSNSYKGNGTMFQTANELHDLVASYRQNVSTFDPANITYRECVLFAWDGNSFVGNEYWDTHFSWSGDPVTVCATALSQLCNPFINKQMLNKIEPKQECKLVGQITVSKPRSVEDGRAVGNVEKYIDSEEDDGGDNGDYDPATTTYGQLPGSKHKSLTQGESDSEDDHQPLPPPLLRRPPRSEENDDGDNGDNGDYLLEGTTVIPDSNPLPSTPGQLTRYYPGEVEGSQPHKVSLSSTSGPLTKYFKTDDSDSYDDYYPDKP